MTPFFSIITATYNAADMLPRLLESLAEQTFMDFEVVIQDGGSRDGTKDVIADYLGVLNITWAAERDSGIYDAWNKAVPRARGEWLLFMGADDILDAEDVLERCHAILRGASETLRYAGGSVQTLSVSSEPMTVIPYSIDKIDKNSWRAMPFPHQGLFHRRALFAEQLFDASLRIVGDYDFVCRTWTEENGNLILPFVVTRMRRGGISDAPSSKLRLRWELAVVSSRYAKNVWTISCFIGLAKGAVLWLVCRLLGDRAPAALDTFRQLRGLPPVWRGL